MFIAVKLAELATRPLNLVLLALVVACALLVLGRLRAARLLVGGVALALLLVAVLPLERWLLSPLESRIPPPLHLERVDGIIVLGGAVEPEMTEAHGQPALNGSAERMTAMVELARRYPQARLVFTGGSGSIWRPDLKEAAVARTLLEGMGVDSMRVVYEDQSRNTWENAVFSRSLVTPRPGEVWLLVTSAWHMPRALGAFRAAGWEVVPYAVDYRTGRDRGLRLDVAGGVGALQLAMHEWFGLAYYYYQDWSDSLYPAL